MLINDTAAFILAAGFGSRMMPLTANKPKAMVEFAGVSLIERQLDYLQQSNIGHVYINTHYKADIFTKYIDAISNKYSFKIELLYEANILDTGGAIKHLFSLHKLDKPFFVINCDIFWSSKNNILQQMLDQWNSSYAMLLMLVDKSNAFGYSGAGDFDLTCDNLVIKNPHNPFIFTGVKLIDPVVIDGKYPEIFSFNDVISNNANKTFGCKLSGSWYHIGDPYSLTICEALINKES